MGAYTIRGISKWELSLAFLLIIGLGILAVLLGARNPVLSITLTSVLLWGLAGLWKPRIAFFLFLALLPFVDFLKRLQLAFTAPSALEWNLVLASPDILLLSSALGVVLQRALQGRLTVVLTRTDWWLLAFLASMLFSIFHSVFPVTVGMAVFKLSGLYILIYFLAPALIAKRQHLRFLLGMSFVLSLVTALYGMWQTVFGMTWFEKMWLTGGYTGQSIETIIYYVFRPFSTLSGPQAYAYYLVIGLTFGRMYVDSLGYRNKSKEIMCYVGILVLVIALGLSLVRTALLFWGLIWLLSRYLPKIRLRYHPIMLLLIATSFTLILIYVLLRFGGPIQDRASDFGIPFIRRAFTLGTLSDRLRGWQGAVSDSRFWTPLGYGLGTTSFTVMSKYGLTFDLFSHDEYTNILIEQGVIGLMLFLGFIISWMRRVVLNLQATQVPFLKKTGWILMGFSLSTLLVGLLGTNLKVSPVNVYFWLVVGLLARSPMWRVEQILVGGKDA